MVTEKNKLNNYLEYAKGVYEYKTQKGYTLIENGKILCKDVIYCCWYAKGAYKYQTQEGYTLVENGKVLCKGVIYCHWYEKGVYEYIKIENGNKLRNNTNN